MSRCVCVGFQKAPKLQLQRGLFALLSCLACFIGTYFLSHHVNAGGKETGWGVILTLLFLAMFKFLAEASNTKDIQLTNPSVLLGIFLGVAWMIAALFLVDSNERKGFWKPIYSKILLILLNSVAGPLCFLKFTELPF